MKKLKKKARLIRNISLTGVVIIMFLLTLLTSCMTVSMPGESFQGTLPEFTNNEEALAGGLKEDVKYLADIIGERNLENYENLQKTVDFIDKSFIKAGYKPIKQEYSVEADFLSSSWNNTNYQSHKYYNIIAELKGTELPEEIIVIGAHYDSAPVAGCRAANDNGSGVAATLAMARHFSGKPQKRTLRFVAFANEEPPYFWTEKMGSYVYAKSCKDKNENIVAMLTPETIGYYSDEEDSQSYPFPMSWFYPSTGNFIAFVGNNSSSDLTEKCVKIFRENTKFPCEGAALPMLIPRIGSSDHWSFWKMGYHAVMVTDTAPYRYPFYHTNQDDSDKINYQKMARVVKGLETVVKNLANEPPEK